MSVSQNSATTPASNSSAPASTPKLRSCVVCRSRKVRCDKLSPCSNCRRANIPCVLPSSDRPPRWARRLERGINNAASDVQASAQVMERLRTLEDLVKELRGQLEQAEASHSGTHGSPEVNSPGNSSHDRDTDPQRDPSPRTDTENLHKPLGRLVLQDANRSRYVSSAFWSRVNDELDGIGSDTSDDEEYSRSRGSSSTQEFQRTPSERHAFLFRHNMSPSAPDLLEFHPLPSQVPFLLNVFCDNVNAISGIVHTPTISSLVRDSRGSQLANLSPANEALMFSIYYAAITSMEADDVMTNFGATKTELNLKYRLGLEHALARADFLNVPELVLLQAFTIFLMLARRHDSPRFVWMMTGLAIRMAQALGLHRDGTHFKNLTPYEIEMRRRVWWTLIMLDVRSSEDQGTEFTIHSGSYDTKFPLNINDTDIDPKTTVMPTAREGITDFTFPLTSFEMGEVSKEMMAYSSKGEGIEGIAEQNRLLNEIYRRSQQGYLQYVVGTGNILYWVGSTITRLVMDKMTLLIYLPILFSAPSENLSDAIKSKLLVAAVQLAEYNHALNAEKECRHWRWLFQTYTHWYAVVYLLLETTRRPWSPIVERAWVALHSEWLIPAQSHINKDLRLWVPLRKLMAKAGNHRDSELARLRVDVQAAQQLEIEDTRIPVPESQGPFPAGSNAAELFLQRWRQLVGLTNGPGQDNYVSPQSSSIAPSSSSPANASQLDMGQVPTYIPTSAENGTGSQQVYGQFTALPNSQSLPGDTTRYLQPSSTPITNSPGNVGTEQHVEPSYHTAPEAASAWSMGPGFVPWTWPDSDPANDSFQDIGTDAMDINMDLDGVNWYNWLESAKDMEIGAMANNSGQT